MVNGRRYVGQTTRRVEERFKEHASGKKYLIGKAIRKYGRENFRYGVIRSCASKEELNAQEIYFIATLHCKAPYGYNLTDGGEGTAGLERTDEYRKKRSAKTCKNISDSLKGTIFTKERCANISIAQRGYSPYKNLIAELDARNLSYAALARIMGAVPNVSFSQNDRQTKFHGARQN